MENRDKFDMIRERKRDGKDFAGDWGKSLHSRWRASTKGPRGRTKLHTAAQEGDTEKVVSLLKRDANVNARQSNGWTPLHGAAFGGHTETAEVLLRSKAHVNARTGDGWTPLHVAAYWGHTETAEVSQKSGFASKVFSTRQRRFICNLRQR